MGDILFYISLVIVGIWTARLAKAKGRSAFWWGLAAAILMIIPTPTRLLGVLPMFFLLFLKRPESAPAHEPHYLECPRCETQLASALRFCTKCGWELARPFSQETQDQTAAVATDPPAHDDSFAEPPTVTLQSESSASVESSPPATELEVETPQPDIQADSTATVRKPTVDAPLADAPLADAPEPEPTLGFQESSEPAPAKPELPKHRGVPTAASMTEHGLRLLEGGHFQLAIDQFTKAIALNSKFKEAWDQRAEAYAQMGRADEAAEDRRRSQAIATSS